MKLQNILLNEQGVLKLADFGIASLSSVDSSGKVEGSPYWMAPEVIMLEGAKTVSDIWSLGCTIIEVNNIDYDN